MYLGIDVGGTHTDGVRLGEGFAIAATAKVRTDHGAIIDSLTAVLSRLLEGVDPGAATRLVVSSTIGLNAVLTGRADPVGVLATGGPGLSPRHAMDGPLMALLPGALDHRGAEVAPFDGEAAGRECQRLLQAGAKAWAVISKFGPKNHGFEARMAAAAAAAAPGFPLTRASELAGRLNFPRRLNTAVLNSATTRLYGRFIDDLAGAAARLGLKCPISLLSSEGGAMGLAEARKSPVMILAAGPAAGILGLWAMAGLSGDALMVDIGGTSTDLAIMADGRPLMASEGLEIAGRPTLVRAFLTSSIALGGDSALTYKDGQMLVGPEREGAALALSPADVGRRRPTLTDALNVLGRGQVGDAAVSRRALGLLGGPGPEALAQAALDQAMAMAQAAVAGLLYRVNNRPVYTLDEVRLAREVRPLRAALLGGPAESLAGPLGERLKMPITVPPQFDVANAVGTARARPAVSLDLYADTALGRLSIPGLGLTEKIGRAYDARQAEAELLAKLAASPQGQGAEKPVITQSQSFNQLTGYGRADKIIRVQAQITPGVLSCGKN